MRFADESERDEFHAMRGGWGGFGGERGPRRRKGEEEFSIYVGLHDMSFEWRPLYRLFLAELGRSQLGVIFELLFEFGECGSFVRFERVGLLSFVVHFQGHERGGHCFDRLRIEPEIRRCELRFRRGHSEF
jgi:hypothetical protein